MHFSAPAKTTEMWPTPRVGGSNRNSRKAVTNTNHADRSGLGLEQMVELAQGQMPLEYEDVQEMAPQARRLYEATPTSQQPGSEPMESSAAALPLWPTPSACTANDGKAPVECAPAPSTSSSVGLLASRLRRLVSALVTGTADGSGARHCASLETSDPGGPYWRMFQACLPCDTATGSRPLDEYSSSYPRWGTVAAGECGVPVMSALRIDATECSSSPDEQTWATPASSWTEGRGTTRPETWQKRRQARIAAGKQPFADPLHVQAARQDWPTPTVPNGGRSPRGGMSPTGMTPEGIKRQADLGHHVRMVEQEQWPTPRAADAERTADASYSPERGASLTGRLRPIKTGQGQLNPAFVESLMGFPPGWTDVPPAPKRHKIKRRKT